MIIQSVYIQNFMGFKEASLTLTDYEGITLIEGKCDGAGRDSNGAGKSAILDAITWCLFGKLMRPTRRAKADDVMYRFGARERTVVVVNLEIDERTVVVERSRTANGPNFKVSGFKDGTTAGMQESLEGMIGFNFKTFTSSVMFGGASSSFCSMTDSEKKEVLEEMLEIDYFLSAQKVAAADATELEGEIEALQLRIRNIDDNVLSYQDMLDSLKEKNKNWRHEVRERLLDLLEENEDTFDEREETSDALLAARADYKKRMVNFKVDYSKWEDRYAEQEAIVVEKEKIVTALEHEESEIKGAKRIAVADLKKVEKDDRPDICPTCGQRWPKDVKDDDEAVKRLTEQYQKAVDKQDAQLAIVKRKLEKARREYDDVYSILERINREEPKDLPSRTDFLSKFVVARRDALSAHRSTLRALKEHRAGMRKNPYKPQIKELLERIEKTEASKDTIQDRIKEIETDSLIARYWADEFGRRGLPSYLIDSAIPTLNESAKEISEILTESDLFVYFDPAGARGSQSVLNVEVEFEDGGDNYDMTSRGEHNRVDLTVLFSLRDLIASRGRHVCKQVFVDEVFDGLDLSGLQAVVKLLRNRYDDFSVFVISHDLEMKGLVDNVITVEKRGHVSQIVA